MSDLAPKSLTTMNALQQKYSSVVKNDTKKKNLGKFLNQPPKVDTSNKDLQYFTGNPERKNASDLDFQELR